MRAKFFWTSFIHQRFWGCSASFRVTGLFALGRCVPSLFKLRSNAHHSKVVVQCQYSCSGLCAWTYQGSVSVIILTPGQDPFEEFLAGNQRLERAVSVFWHIPVLVLQQLVKCATWGELKFFCLRTRGRAILSLLRNVSHIDNGSLGTKKKNNQKQTAHFGSCPGDWPGHIGYTFCFPFWLEQTQWVRNLQNHSSGAPEGFVSW